MPSVPFIKRKNKRQAHVDRPLTVTGSFELHYEEVMRRNRLAIIAFVATGLIAIAAFIPTAVYHSVAGTETVTVEPEDASLNDKVQVGKDPDTSGGEFILFINKK